MTTTKLNPAEKAETTRFWNERVSDYRRSIDYEVKCLRFWWPRRHTGPVALDMVKIAVHALRVWERRLVRATYRLDRLPLPYDRK